MGRHQEESPHADDTDNDGRRMQQRVAAATTRCLKARDAESRTYLRADEVARLLAVRGPAASDQLQPGSG